MKHTDKTTINTAIRISTVSSDTEPITVTVIREIRTADKTPRTTNHKTNIDILNLINSMTSDTDTFSTSRSTVYRPKPPLKSTISVKEYQNTVNELRVIIGHLMDVIMEDTEEVDTYTGLGGRFRLRLPTPPIHVPRLVAYIWYMNLLRTNPFNYITNIPLTIEIREI